MTTPQRYGDPIFERLHPRVEDGTFTAKPQSAPEATLAPAPSVDAAFITAWNHAHGRPGVDAEIATLVADELNETRNFSDANIAANIDAAYTAIHGYSPEVKQNYEQALATLRRNLFEDSAGYVEEYVAALIAKNAAPEMTDAQAAAATDGIVPTSDPRVQSGEILDRVVAHDGVVFHRRRLGVFPDWPNEMRIQANRELSEDDQDKLAGLLGYAYRAEVRGEPMSNPQFDTKFSLIVGADVTKSSSDDTGMALERFEDKLAEIVRDGSPIRTTDRAGAGTAGTRLIDGFGPGFDFELYYDSVIAD